MFTTDEMISFQAEHHPLEHTRFDTIEEYCLYLMHLRAYEEAGRLAQGLQILDLGCNNGYGSATLSETAASVNGVDVSPTAIEKAKQIHGKPNLQFQVIDGSLLPFPDNSFDFVVTCQVIEHVSDTDKFLGEIIRVLRNNGTLLLTTPNALIRLEPGMQPWNKFHVQEFTPTGLHNELRRFFSDVEVKGLFANPDLYKVERERVERAKLKAQQSWRTILPPFWKIRAVIIDLIKASLPGSLIDFIRRKNRPNAVRDPISPPIAPEWITKYHTSDFFYRTKEIDGALDLIALCKCRK